MRCDKCRKKFQDNWEPGSMYPKYGITEKTDLMSITNINLCMNCSQLFQEWLNEEPEEDEGFGR